MSYELDLTQPLLGEHASCGVERQPAAFRVNNSAVLIRKAARSATNATATSTSNKGRAVPALLRLIILGRDRDLRVGAHRQVARHPPPRPQGAAGGGAAVPASSSPSSSAGARASPPPRPAPLRPLQGGDFGRKCESEVCEE